MTLEVGLSSPTISPPSSSKQGEKEPATALFMQIFPVESRCVALEGAVSLLNQNELSENDLQVISTVFSSLKIEPGALFVRCLKAGLIGIALKFIRNELFDLATVGLNALFDCVSEGYPEIALEISEKISLKEHLESQRTPIFGLLFLKAIDEKTRIKICQFLIDQGININMEDHEGSSPLLLAVRSGQMEMAAFLLKLKAKVNQPNDKGETPLHCALKYGKYNQKMVDLLIEFGADPHFLIKKPGLIKETPLRLAYQAKGASACDKVASLLKIPKERAEKFLRGVLEKRMVAHTNSILGDFNGNSALRSARFLMRALKSMPKDIPDSISESHLHQLMEAYEEMMADTKEQEISRLREGKLFMTPAGYIGHTRYLVFCKGYMAICDRALKSTMQVYKIDPKRFTEEMYDTIISFKNRANCKEGTRFLEDLPHQLSPRDDLEGVQDEACKQLEKSLAPKRAKAGTCTYTSAKAAIRAALAMMQIDCQAGTLQPEECQKAKVFTKHLSTHARFLSLDDYYASPNQDPELDKSLLFSAFKKAYKHAEETPHFSYQPYKHLNREKNSFMLFFELSALIKCS